MSFIGLLFDCLGHSNLITLGGSSRHCCNNLMKFIFQLANLLSTWRKPCKSNEFSVQVDRWGNTENEKYHPAKVY